MKVSMWILLVLIGLNVHAAEEAVPRGGDLGRLQGRWTAKAGTRHEIQVVIEIKGRDVCAAIQTPQGLDFKVQGELKLDETTSPRSLDWKKLTLPDQQPLPEIAAVYKLDGDTFTVCNGGFHGARPKEFKPGEGVLADVVVFHRLDTKDARAGAAPARARPILTPGSYLVVSTGGIKASANGVDLAPPAPLPPVRMSGEVFLVGRGRRPRARCNPSVHQAIARLASGVPNVDGSAESAMAARDLKSSCLH
jgi:uncharacterized protein (TIGR03067 family)